MSERLTLAEVRYSLEAASKHLARLRDRLPEEMPEEAAFLAGVAHGNLDRAIAEIDALTSARDVSGLRVR